MFIKGFNPDMTGYGGFLFVIGKTYIHPDDDSWRWFHYTNSITGALQYYHDPKACFCEITPLGHKQRFHVQGKTYWTTDRIRIDRRLSYNEIIARLEKENCPLFILLDYQAPYELLAKKIGKRPRFGIVYSIVEHPGLSAEQKKLLVPKKYHRLIDT